MPQGFGTARRVSTELFALRRFWVAMGRLDDVDLTQRLPKDEYERRLHGGQKRLLQLRLRCAGLTGEGLGPPLCVVFEGWDASGKGGAIKRLVGELDPRHVRVKSYAAPTPDERRHHFLHRFWPALPGWGGMTVLDRSWYGRVLVERVEGFAPEHVWQRAYGEIVAFERMLADEGMLLVKLWLHISDEEQLRRFEQRANDPLKSWKLTEDDWRNRAKRPQYVEAVEDMLRLADHDGGHWHVVPADDKRLGRVTVLETVNAELERAMRAHGVDVPRPLA
jgi:polyphosphate kinase 2 (PPK2 family)